MRIALDVRAAAHEQPGGFKTYSRELLRRLPEVSPENTFVFYVDRQIDEPALTKFPNVVLRILRTRYGPIGVGLREQFTLPNRLAHERTDIAHFPANTGSLWLPCPTVLTIHDTLMWDEKPQLEGLLPRQLIKRLSMHVYYRYVSKLVALRANRLITVSENSKKDLVRQLGISPDRITVVHNGVGDAYHPIRDRMVIETVRAKFGLSGPYVLALSSASPRKNTPGLLAAYARLNVELRARYKLVIVWTHGLFKGSIAQQAEKLNLQGQVGFIENVTDAELAALYNDASLFVFPSFYEGFGLPPLEAMACGTPVIASNTSSLPEVLGNGALLLDPRDSNLLSGMIARVLQDENLRFELVQKGFARVRRYSWKQCTMQTLQVYQDTLAEIADRKKDPHPSGNPS